MSIVRNNMLTRQGYVPYCGAAKCRFVWPRARFDGEQMTCRCGWKSSFEPEFIEKYKAAQKELPDA